MRDSNVVDKNDIDRIVDSLDYIAELLNQLVEHHATAQASPSQVASSATTEDNGCNPAASDNDKQNR